jgi:hypothetical protein
MIADVLKRVPSVALSSWGEFLELSSPFGDVGLPTEVPYLFRGQPDAENSLRPSFTRPVRRAKLTSKEALDLELQALREFARQAHLHLPQAILRETRGHMAWWSLMQHYQAPTRLLDWTRSAFVAAYFAVEREPDKAGAIWVVHVATVKAWMQAKYGRDTLTLPGADKDAAAEKAESDALRRENAEPELYFVRRPRETDRMAAQQGHFSVSTQILADHAEAILRATEASGKEQFFRFIVPSELKTEFLRKLVAMNVTARSLFPGVDGLGRTVAEIVSLTSQALSSARPTPVA